MSRSNSGAPPSTTNTDSSYASFPSQRSLSVAPSQMSVQHNAASQGAPALSPLHVGAAPQAVKGYQNITSVEPAPKRPLWSLGATLPRVRRLPATQTKTAHPTPGSRSNIVQQPLGMVSGQSNRHAARPAAADSIAAAESRGGPQEPVHGRDYADNTSNQSYNAVGATDADVDSQGLSISPITSANTGTGDLAPIREGEPLPTGCDPVHESKAVTEPSALQARPRLDHSFSSPTAADAADIRVVGGDQLSQPRTAQSIQTSAEPHQRLTTARRQLLEEAQHGDGLLATQGSAIDAEDHDEVEDGKAAPALGGKHVKTWSMPFLPSQGFDVLVPEPSQKGADQLTSEGLERKRSRAESHNRSAMEQTRHPGLSGARPTPRGRAAGGPAAGVGIRKPSTQSHRRASNANNQDYGGAGYFDEDVPLHELAHLERQGSTRIGRTSQQGQQSQEDHIEARPVGGRSASHRSSTGRDTRSAWLGRTMPSHASRSCPEGEASHDGQRTSKDFYHAQRGSLQQDKGRASDETAFSSYSAGGADRTSCEGQRLDAEEPDAQDSTEGQEDDDIWLGGQGTLADGSIAFPTTWSRWRYHSREFLAELLATMLLITVGTAVDCQVTLSQSMGSSAGAYPNQNWAWGLAVASTIYLSGGRSGAHCNPAITLALAVFRGFPWIQVPIYWSAQLLGSILGAAITYGIYLPAIDAYEGGRNVRTLSGEHGTGKLFVTVPQLVFTSASGFGTEVAATSILMAMVLAVGDETNAPPSDGLSALVLGFVVVMIGMSFGWPTSYAISPSRDLGPRLLLYTVGYGRELWTHNAYWWLYGPQAGCFAGALLGALLYDLAIFTGEESPINYTRQGWMQSTPARTGARLLNSADRAHFWKGALGRRKHHTGMVDRSGDRADGSSDLADFGQGSAALSGPWRRPSRALQQLEAQEQGGL